MKKLLKFKKENIIKFDNQEIKLICDILDKYKYYNIENKNNYIHIYKHTSKYRAFKFNIYKTKNSYIIEDIKLKYEMDFDELINYLKNYEK